MMMIKVQKCKSLTVKLREKNKKQKKEIISHD